RPVDLVLSVRSGRVPENRGRVDRAFRGCRRADGRGAQSGPAMGADARFTQRTRGLAVRARLGGETTHEGEVTRDGRGRAYRTSIGPRRSGGGRSAARGRCLSARTAATWQGLRRLLGVSGRQGRGGRIGRSGACARAARGARDRSPAVLSM